MGGVDHMDQFRSYYKVGRKSYKYWKYLLYSLFDISVINSFILYKLKNVKKCNLLLFKNDLIDEMMISYSSRNLPSNRPTPSKKGHKLISAGMRLCWQCNNLGRKNKNGNKIRTRLACDMCDISFCKNCFIDYHANTLNNN